MFITSHVLITLIVFGPRPEAIIGTVLPDVFDYINWIYHRHKGVISFELLKNDPKQFDKNNDQGLIWEIDHALHSFAVFLSCMFFGITGVYTNNVPIAILFLSYGMHLLIDYCTHTRQPFSYIPFGKKSFSIGAYNYGLKSFRAMIIGDFILLPFALWRLFNNLLF